MLEDSSFNIDQDRTGREVIGTVGKTALREIAKLAKYLGYAFPPLLSTTYFSRFAPSVIVRSEILPFNLDIPRFAVRMYLDPNRTCFINVRRMRELRKRIKGYEAITVDHTLKVGVHLAGKKEVLIPGDPSDPAFAEFGRQTSAIADSVLMPPHAVRELFHITETELGWVYGESSSIYGVPYVRPIAALGGAACAQACAFMLSATLVGRSDDEGRSAGVHGLAEISTITGEPREEYIKLAGMTGERLMIYFDRVGRSAYEYTFQGVSALSDLFDCIDVHVRSGFATILSCKPHPHAAENNPDHAVVVVGVPKRDESTHLRKINILVNNPSGRPFEQWDQSLLSKYCMPEGPLKAQACSISALPREVRLPLTLAKWSIGTTKQLWVGVLELARARDALLAQRGQRSIVTKSAIRQFFLVRIQLEKAEDGFSVVFPNKACPLPLDPAFQLLWRQSAQIKYLAGRRCWVQVRRAPNGAISVSVWDAEQHAPEVRDFIEQGDPSRHLLLDIDKNNDLAPWVATVGGAWPPKDYRDDKGKFIRLYPQQVKSAAQNDKPNGKRKSMIQLSNGVLNAIKSIFARHQRPRRPLAPSIITSVSATSLVQSVTGWPGTCDIAELYCFMHGDDALLEPIRKRLKLVDTEGVRPSAVTTLARAYKSNEKDNLLEGLAERICTTIAGKKIVVNALATFVPQLFSHQESIYSEARDALLAVISLASRLKSSGQNIRTIECVAGSTVLGLFPAFDQKGRPVFAMKRRLDPLLLAEVDPSRASEPGTDSVSFVIDRLRYLVAEVDKSVWDDLSIALELEPGPLFALRDHTQLDFFARTLNSDPILGRIIGFNLDIAHFALAKIEPKLIFDAPHIANRICHFHVSDHGIGHFGDCPIGDCSLGDYVVNEHERLIEFRRWTQHALKFAMRRKLLDDKSMPVFSGLISLELEATKSDASLARSYSALCRILDEEWNRMHSTRGPSSPLDLEPA